MHRRWVVRRTNKEYISYLSRAASVSPAFAQILVNRGIKTPGAAIDFLSPGAEALGDPMELQGMARAVAAVEEARNSGSRVLVHGDYDADGLTSTAILVAALRNLGLDVRYFIPNRFVHGYGFTLPGVDHARQVGAGLILTVDCGITSFEAVQRAAALGMGVVITDHHEPLRNPATGEPRLPPALAVVNPRLAGDEAPPLAGAGVALKLLQALALKHPGALEPREFIDLAALGTLADSVALVGENRAIVREGLGLIAGSERSGLKALKAVSGLEGRRLKAGLLAFTLVPRMNAPGRLAGAEEVVELLLAPDAGRAEKLARSLDRQNAERQKIEEQVFQEALEVLEGREPGPAVVLAREGWHEGVLGIVASRLVERLSRPAFVLSIRGDTARGSARSIPAFDVHAGLEALSGQLLAFGGHKQAAGLTVQASRIGEFESRICQIVTGSLREETPTLFIDAAVGLREINRRFLKELEGLEPFGAGNPEPVMGSRALEVISARVVGKNHLKMRLRSRSMVMDAIGFDMGGLLGTIEETVAVDAAYAAAMNEWEGGRSIQLQLKGLRSS
jgi:single-stranded-DNA-specific exonuclease